MEVFDIINDLSGLEFKAYFHDWLIYGDGDKRYALKPLKEEKAYLVCSVYDINLAKDSHFIQLLLKAEGIEV